MQIADIFYYHRGITVEKIKAAESDEERADLLEKCGGAVALDFIQTGGDDVRGALEELLKSVDGNQKKAAERIHLPRTTLREYLTRHGLI